MTIIAAFMIGIVLGGIVCFFVAACIVAEHRFDKRKVYEDGYRHGAYDHGHKILRDDEYADYVNGERD